MGPYHFRSLEGLQVYFGTHPAVMNDPIGQHALSQEEIGKILAVSIGIILHGFLGSGIKRQGVSKKN